MGATVNMVRAADGLWEARTSYELTEELTGLNIALRKLLVDGEQSTHQIYLEMLNDIFGQNKSIQMFLLKYLSIS